MIILNKIKNIRGSSRFPPKHTFCSASKQSVKVQKRIRKKLMLFFLNQEFQDKRKSFFSFSSAPNPLLYKCLYTPDALKFFFRLICSYCFSSQPRSSVRWTNLQHSFFLTKFNCLFFEVPNELIWPVRQPHLATSAFVAQHILQY